MTAALVLIPSPGSRHLQDLVDDALRPHIAELTASDPLEWRGRWTDWQFAPELLDDRQPAFAFAEPGPHDAAVTRPEAIREFAELDVFVAGELVLERGGHVDGRFEAAAREQLAAHDGLVAAVRVRFELDELLAADGAREA
jgi:hypothetical protein